MPQSDINSPEELMVEIYRAIYAGDSHSTDLR